MWNPSNGVLFGDRHTYRDWGLYLKSRPAVSPPSVKTVYEDLPGADGVLDFTESLTGDVEYDNRDIKFEFKVIGGRDKWYDMFSTILDALHGKKMRVIIDEDPSYYYYGRVSVDEWESSEVTSSIVINVESNPYKEELNSSLEDWVWDTFNFETGIVRDYSELIVNGSLTLVVPGRRKRVVPTFKVAESANLKVVFNGSTYNLSDGDNNIPNIVLPEGENILKFTGTGTVSVDYRGGRL